MGPKKRKVEEEDVEQEETVGTLHEMFPNAPLRVIKVNGVEGQFVRFEICLNYLEQRSQVSPKISKSEGLEPSLVLQVI